MTRMLMGYKCDCIHSIMASTSDILIAADAEGVGKPGDTTDFVDSTFERYYEETVHAPSGYIEFCFSILVDGTIQAAIEGSAFWGGMVISRLTVGHEYRKHGLGTWLMHAALRWGREHGAGVACVETFDYQAPNFYPRFGFRDDMQRPGFSRGLKYHYLSKSLDDSCMLVDVPTSKSVTADDGSVHTAVLSSPLSNKDGSTSVTTEISDFMRSVYKEQAEKTVGADSNFSMFEFTARKRETGELVGVVNGKIFWGSIFVSHCIIKKEYRKTGVGSRLLRKALEHGRDLGCTIACLETFDFQSPRFYEKVGFHADLIRPGWKKGASFYYFSRSLPAVGPVMPEEAADTPTESPTAVAKAKT
jgi:GNAT superfamily N-acetyltransferase